MMRSQLQSLLHLFLIILLPNSLIVAIANEQERVFRVSESLPGGQHIGFVRGESGEPLEVQDKQNFFIVFPPDGNGTAERILRVDERTGEVSLQLGQSLDHETATHLHALAIPVDGSDPITIRVEILDENDNAPMFPVESVKVEISEYARINMEMNLPMASDRDAGQFGVQRYRIAAGNVNNAFRLSYSPELYLNLVVNGQLDREYRARYDLVVEAFDGGKSPKSGTLRVQVDVLDANDNPPEFIQQHYSARIGPGTGPGIPILRVAARDPDEAENGRISYAIGTQTLVDGSTTTSSYLVPSDLFQIDSQTGTISLRHPLPAQLPQSSLFELVVIAKDQGIPQSLESSATVQILADGIGQEDAAQIEGRPAHRLTLIWLTEDGTAEHVPEGIPLGQVLARMAVEGGNPKDKLRLVLLGGQSSVCLRQADFGRVYLLVVCGPLDRERTPTLQIDLLLRNGSAGEEVLLDHPLHFVLEDVNDNAPTWNSTQFRLEWPLDEDGFLVEDPLLNAQFRLVAQDLDSGDNGRVRYRLIGTDLFGIDSETGQLWARQEKMPFCSSSENKDALQFQVEAEDHGRPRLSAKTNVSIHLVPAPASQTQRIRFSQPLYELTIPEDIRPGSCILQVAATDVASCQNRTNALHFWLVDGPSSNLFKLDAKTGVLCTKEWLDFEALGEYIQLSAMAGNEDGDERTAQVLLRLEDVNDNAPVFQPKEYAVLLSADGLDPTVPLLQVRALDLDNSPKFHTITYEIGEGVGAELFKIDSKSGELRLSELGVKKLAMAAHEENDGGTGMYSLELRVEARDAGGKASVEAALVRVRLLPSHLHCMTFAERIFRFRISEDTLPGIAIGDLRVLDLADPDKVRFEIVRAEDDKQSTLFAFDEGRPNRLVLEGELDADGVGGGVLLLNVKAVDGVRNCTNFTQVLLEVIDANDNGPEFGFARMHVTVAEDQPIHVPFYAVKAIDKDGGHQNGHISYELLDTAPSSLPLLVDPETGALSLSAPLDADASQNGQNNGTFTVKIRAQDHGIPPRQAILELLLTILDVNDNAPQFAQPEYNIEVPEDAELMRSLLRAEATDVDRSPANRRLHYRISQLSPVLDEGEPVLAVLGVNARTGEIFLRHQLNREQFGEYSFELRAIDGGSPPLSSSARIHLRVLDVNDNAPNCTRQTLQLQQGQKAGDRIGQLAAIDLDQGANGLVRFRLQQPNALFQLTASGEVLLKRDLSAGTETGTPLNAVDTNSLAFAVIVEDQNDEGNSLSTVCQVTVNLPNGTTPTNGIHLFGPIPEEILLDSNAQEGTVLLHINASGVKRWSLEESALSKFFAINEGAIRLARKPSEAERQFPMLSGSKLIVRMQSNAGHNKLLTFRVQHRPPSAEVQNRFKSSMVRIPPNWSPRWQKPLFQMDAIGKNQSSSSHYFFKLDGADDVADKMIANGLFELDELSGALYLADLSPLDNPSVNSPEGIHLRISAHSRDESNEAEENQLDRLITIQLEDWLERRRAASYRPNCKELFAQWNISEAVPIGTFVGRLEPRNGNKQNGSNLFSDGAHSFRYELLEGMEHFRVDSETGEVFTVETLDMQLSDKHILVFKVVAVKQPNDWTKCVRMVKLQHHDDNDTNTSTRAPQFLSWPNATLFLANFEHGLYANGVFHHFLTNQEKAEFHIITGDEDALFSLDPNSGALSVIHFERLPSNSTSIRLTIRASNGLNPKQFTLQQFTLHLEHSDGRKKLAYFRQKQFIATLQIGEVAASGSSQFLASFRNKEKHEDVEFMVLPLLTGFKLDQNEGSLLYMAPPEGIQIYRNLTLIVVAKEANSSTPHFDWARLDIVPAVANGGPNLEPSSCGNLSVPKGVSIADLLRVRLLQNGTESFASSTVFAIEGGNWHSLFSIDPRSGWLSCKPLDRETMAEHLLMISATDLSSSPRKADVCSVRIEVLDRNDNAPEWKMANDQLHLELPDDAQPGYGLTRLEAEDADDGQEGKVCFLLDNDPSGAFDLNPDTGELQFARETPYLQGQTGVWLIVRAMDQGNPKSLSSEPKRIRVEWSKQRIAGKTELLAFSRRLKIADVWEGLPRGQVVAKLELVNNSSKNGPISFSIVGGNLDAAFQLDASGQVRTALELDAEIRAFYLLHILAISGDGQRAECHLRVRVLDREDNAPAIRRIGTIRLAEDTPVGSLVASMNGRDVDSSSTSLEYFLVEPSSAHFDINRWTGRIHLAKPLDFEVQKKHWLHVQVSDGINRSFNNFTVEVIDINDNAPKFERNFIEIEVAKQLKPGTLLLKLEARDLDGTERNARIAYELIGDANDWVTLDRVNGELRLKKNPRSGHFVTVKASDSGRIPLSSFCTIWLYQAAFSKQRPTPTFANANFSFSVAEHSSRHLPIGQLRLDSHSPHSQNCNFRLISPANPTAASLFRVDFSGTIFMDSENVDRELLSEWMEMEAIFTHCPPPLLLPNQNNGNKEQRATVRIHMLDVNDNWPEFERGKKEEIVALDATMEKGRLLTKLHASDRDATEENSRLSFHLLAGDDFGMLSLDETNGDLRFGHWEDGFTWNKEDGEQLVVIAARDSGIPQRSTIKLLHLKWPEGGNASVPMFAAPIYRKFVEEETRPGTVLFRVNALCTGKCPNYMYSLEMDILEMLNETFSIDPKSGEVSALARLDMEAENNNLFESHSPADTPIVFNITVQNEYGNVAKVPVEIFLVGRDEFAPVFVKSAFTFKLSPQPILGQPIGQVLAIDRDIGMGSRVHYSLDPADLLTSQLITVDAWNGTLRLLRIPAPSSDGSGNETEEPTVLRLTVWAESGWTDGNTRKPPKRTSAAVYIEIGTGTISSADEVPGMPASSPPHHWLPLLLLPFLLLLLCCLISLLLAKLLLRTQRLPSGKCQQEADFLRPTPKKRVFTVATCKELQLQQQQQQFGIVGRTLSPSFESGQFSRPRETDHFEHGLSLPSAAKAGNYMNLPTSNTSTSGNAHSLAVMQSCGSRRSQPDSGIDPDRTSEGSEENGLGVADEYLRQLGVEEKGEEQPTNSLAEHSEEAFLDELVYAPLEEIFGIQQQQKGENERWMPPRKQSLTALSQPVIVGESRNLEDLLPFKPLSQMLAEMNSLEKEDPLRGSRV